VAHDCARLSNRDGTAGPLRILHIDGNVTRSANQLLRMLCTAANAGRRTGTPPVMAAASCQTQMPLRCITTH